MRLLRLSRLFASPAMVCAAGLAALLPGPATVGAETSAAVPEPLYYFISDMHIGGDGDLDRCPFEPELIRFLGEIAEGPLPAELIIVGDAFGLWETTVVEGEAKLRRIIDNHPALFEGFRETGRRVVITLLSGNHDYDLACLPGYRELLAGYNIRLDAGIHTTRTVAGRTVWIEHGNQNDSLNAFPDFGNRWGLPSGYFVTVATVAAAGRSAQRGRSPWVSDLASVYPTEDIPFWIWSNYFYKEMSPILRWLLLPFLLLFGVSVVVFLGQALERYGVLRTKIFHIQFSGRFGLAGRLVDWVLWANGIVISFVLILAIPLYFLSRDIREALRRYGVDASAGLKIDKEAEYLEAANAVFDKDPSAALYIYGHTHVPSLRKVGSRYVVNTGTWMKRLERVGSHFRLMPDVYVPSWCLNYFTVSRKGDGILLGYHVIPKSQPRDLTLTERLMIAGRILSNEGMIPAETFIGPATDKPGAGG